MSGRVAGKVALVTGAARGIGRACALRLAEEGADVGLIDIARDVETVPYPGARPDELRATADQVAALGRRAVAETADVTDGAAVAAAVAAIRARLGRIDILVAAAGIDSWGDAWELTEAQWQSMLDVNLGGVWRAAKAAAPAMIEQGAGAMVFIGSVLSHRANRQFAHYTAAKHGVLGLVRAAAAEYARTGVTVNAICPGYVDTPMTDATVQAIAARTDRSPDEARATLARRQPIGRLIAPDEVAEAVRFCLANAAVTGQGINVDGGAVQS